MTKYLANSFSLQMLGEVESININIVKVNSFPADCVSAIGHQDTANVLGVPMNRINIKLEKGDELYVAQLTGGRLPERATTLPEGFKFVFYKVTIM